jgi:hypothetical protein
LTTGGPKTSGNHRFKFELGWLQRDGFHDIVKSVWDFPNTAASPILRWNNKIHALRSHLSGWARHVSGVLKKEKLRLSSTIEDLEALDEVGPLSTHEIELKNQSNAKIASLLREEELKWYQRSKSQFILEGDSNTHYVHSVANNRHRKKWIHTLVQDEGTIEGLDNLKAYITNYYKICLGHRKKGTSTWMSLERMIFPKFPMRKITFLRLSTRKRK